MDEKVGFVFMPLSIRCTRVWSTIRQITFQRICSPIGQFCPHWWAVLVVLQPVTNTPPILCTRAGFAMEKVKSEGSHSTNTLDYRWRKFAESLASLANPAKAISHVDGAFVVIEDRNKFLLCFFFYFTENPVFGTPLRSEARTHLVWFWVWPWALHQDKFSFTIKKSKRNTCSSWHMSPFLFREFDRRDWVLYIPATD